MGKTSINVTESRIVASLPAPDDSAIAIAVKSTRGPIDRVCTINSLEQLVKIYGEAPASGDDKSLAKAKYLVKRGSTLQVFKRESGGVKATVKLVLRAAGTGVTETSLTLEAIGPGVGYNGLYVEANLYSGNMFGLVFKTAAQGTVLERYNILSLDPENEYYVGNILFNSFIATAKTVVGTEFSKSSTPVTGAFASGTAPTSYIDYSVLRSREIPFCALLTDNIGEAAGADGITLKTLLDERKDFVVVIAKDRTDITNITFASDELDSYLVRVAPQVTIPGLNTKDAAIAVVDVIASLHRRNLVYKSPGGLENGILKDVLKIDTPLTDQQVEDLQGAGVNPIVVKTGYGITLWGNYTSCTTPAYVQDLATRLLANYLKRAIFRVSQPFIFREHTEFTWNQWKGTVEPLIRDIAVVGGLNNYEVVCDRTIMSDSDIANGILRGHVTIHPVGHLQKIFISLFIDESGVTFE